MNHDDESTQSLLDQNENEDSKTIQIIEDIHVRNRREPVKMTNRLLIYFLAFAVFVTLVYAVSYAATGDAYGDFKEKGTFWNSNQTETSNIILKHHQFSTATQNINLDSLWTYDCANKICIRRLLEKDEKLTSLEKCNMICNRPSLWPKPKSLTLKDHGLSTFRKSVVLTKIHSPNILEEDLKRAVDIFMFNLPSSNRFWLEDFELRNIFIDIKVTSDETEIKIETDESYKLCVKRVNEHVVVNVTAHTYFGARHALETLNQLIIYDSPTKKLQIYHDLEIQDSPAFPHRGLMIDTARNFFPIEQLLRVVDGMAMNKMNVLHLHLTDAVSFPVVLPSNPWLAEYGAYGPDMMYSANDIKGLVEYARLRGIRVILEIDAPSHANEGWNHKNTDKEKTIICGDNDIFNGHLNPDNNNTFNLLQTIYSDLLELGTDRETFHIGGDEVNLNCLAETQSAKNFSDVHEFWANYMNKIFDAVGNAFNKSPPKNIVIWSSPLTDWYLRSLKYSKNLVVQYWFGKIDPILHNGNKIIFSTVGRWYLDCGFGPWKPSETHGACDPYTPWSTFYNYRPWQEYPAYRSQVLGGEACLWTEQVGVDTLESRLWPRSAAVAERLWSDLPQLDLYDVSTRFSDQRERLIKKGLKVATVWPKWCSLHPGKCR